MPTVRSSRHRESINQECIPRSYDNTSWESLWRTISELCFMFWRPEHSNHPTTATTQPQQGPNRIKDPTAATTQSQQRPSHSNEPVTATNDPVTARTQFIDKQSIDLIMYNLNYFMTKTVGNWRVVTIDVIIKIKGWMFVHYTQTFTHRRWQCKEVTMFELGLFAKQVLIDFSCWMNAIVC